MKKSVYCIPLIPSCLGAENCNLIATCMLTPGLIPFKNYGVFVPKNVENTLEWHPCTCISLVGVSWCLLGMKISFNQYYCKKRIVHKQFSSIF